MNRVDLASPKLRSKDLPYAEFAYTIEQRQFLEIPGPLPEVPLSQVLASRSSRRLFQPVTLEALNSLLWYSARALEVTPATLPRWQHRPAPSAGGKHPLDLLIFRSEGESTVPELYEATAHALARLKLSTAEFLHHFLNNLNQVLNIEEGVIIWFAAQFDRTLAKYENGESLVWRDCGALLATISLVAEALDLNCCAVGITGEPYVSQMLASNKQVIGAGGMILGARI